MLSKAELLLRLYRSNFAAFNRFAFRELHSHRVFLDNWHIELMADLLTRCVTGEISRLIINVPPRHLKSQTASVAFALWMLGRYPDKQILSLVGTRELASDQNEAIDRLIASPRVRAVFPNLAMPKTSGQIRMHHGGRRASGIVGQSQVGRGADVIIIDDPMPPQVARKHRARQSVIGWFEEEIIQRLNDKSDGVIILVAHRVHPEDLTHHLLTMSDDWNVLSIPAIAMNDESWAMSDGSVFRRAKGEALMPSLECRNDLRQMMLNVGASRFGAQYQQAPFLPLNPQEVRGGAFRHVAEDGMESMWFGTIPETTIMLHEVFGEGDRHPAEPPRRMSIEEWSEKAAEHQRKMEEEMARLMDDSIPEAKRSKDFQPT